MNINIPGAYSFLYNAHVTIFSWTLLLGPRIRESGGGVLNGAQPFGCYW